MLTTMKVSNEKFQQLVTYFKQNFVKYCLKDSEIQSLLSNAQFYQCNINQRIFSQGDSITHYYFLIKGIVALCKNIHSRTDRQQQAYLQQLETVQAGKVIGEYFSSQHIHREYSAVVRSEQAQIVKIQVKIFDSLCQALKTQFNSIDRFAKNILKVESKISSFDIFNIKNYGLGSSIKLQGEIGIILHGQCKVLQISRVEVKKSQSPSKYNLPSISISKTKAVSKQIALIGQNQWIFTENIENTASTTQHKYLVSSERLSLLTLPISYVGILPNRKIQELKKIHEGRKQRANYSERLSYRVDHKRQAELSPSLKKARLDQAHRILQKLDPNISPNLILKKYKLGYNAIRYENYDKKQQHALVSQVQQMRRQKTERKLKKYFKAKDWSQYVRIPNMED